MQKACTRVMVAGDPWIWEALQITVVQYLLYGEICCASQQAALLKENGDPTNGSREVGGRQGEFSF